jgi:hypothetical protein
MKRTIALSGDGNYKVSSPKMLTVTGKLNKDKLSLVTRAFEQLSKANPPETLSSNDPPAPLDRYRRRLGPKPWSGVAVESHAMFKLSLGQNEPTRSIVGFLAPPFFPWEMTPWKAAVDLVNAIRISAEIPARVSAALAGLTGEQEQSARESIKSGSGRFRVFEALDREIHAIRLDVAELVATPTEVNTLLGAIVDAIPGPQRSEPNNIVVFGKPRETTVLEILEHAMKGVREALGADPDDELKLTVIDRPNSAGLEYRIESAAAQMEYGGSDAAP